MRVWSTELKEHVGERVELQGWLLNHRPLSRVDFVNLRDGKGVWQIVVNDESGRAEVAKSPRPRSPRRSTSAFPS